MSKIDFRGLAEQALAKGEDFLCGVRVNWNGMIQPTRVSGPQGLSGLGVEQETPPPDPDSLVTFPSAKQMVIALTGGRILCWSLGFSGKPKQYLGEVPLSAIEMVKMGEIRFGPLLRIVLRSGAAVDLEVMRGDDGELFYDNLVALVGDGTGAEGVGPGGYDEGGKTEGGDTGPITQF